MTNLITRKEYMADSKNLHKLYYEQFVTSGVIQLVKNRIGLQRIINSTDPYFNDIPLIEWDRLNGLVKTYSDTRKKSEAEGCEKGKYLWSLSDGVCIAKAAARMIKSSHKDENNENT